MAANCTFLGKDTSVNGIITTHEIVVEGSIKGEVNARDKVHIKRGAVIEGPIKTKKILFEEGAKHFGMIRMNNSKFPADSTSPEPPKLEEQLKEEKKEEKKKEKPVLTEKKAEESPPRERLW